MRVPVLPKGSKLTLCERCRFPHWGGSGRPRSEFGTWLTCCSLMGLRRFNSIDCAVYGADALKRESTFNKRFIFPSLPTVTLKVGEALLGTWPQSKLSKPSLPLALNSGESEWNTRREDFPVFPAVTFRAVQTPVLNSSEARPFCDPGRPNDAHVPSPAPLAEPPRPCGRQGEDARARRESRAPGSLSAAGRRPARGRGRVRVRVPGREGEAPAHACRRPCPPPELGWAPRRRCRPRHAGKLRPRAGCALPPAGPENKGPRAAASPPRAEPRRCPQPPAAPRPGGASLRGARSGAGARRGAARSSAGPRPCPWCCHPPARGQPRRAQPSRGSVRRGNGTRGPERTRGCRPPSALFSGGGEAAGAAQPAAWGILLRWVHSEEGRAEAASSERAAARVEVRSWLGTMAALPRLVCASSVVLVVWGRCFHCMLSSARFSTKSGACLLQDAALKHRFS